MSILIKGMEMPTKGEALVIFSDGNAALYDRIDVEILDFPKKNRKAIPVPQHGDLIDRGAFLAEQRHLYCENCARRKGMKNGKMKFVYDIGDAPCRACGYGDVLDDIEDAPTIIPAEGGDAE